MNYTGTMNAENLTPAKPINEPINTMNNRVNETIAMLKELLMAMDDTSIALFGNIVDRPIHGDMPKEMKCMDDAVNVVAEQARTALATFMEIRKRLV